MNKITIQDVAKKAGVSKGTVSAVINGKNSVKVSTRERVRDVMLELNFRPKGQARNLKSQSIDQSIGLIIRELDSPFNTVLANGVKDQANSKGYIEFISSSESDHEKEKHITELLVSKDIKGAIISPTINEKIEIGHFFRLKLLNYPFVLLREVPGLQANVVAIDYPQASMQAVKYLIKTGHKNIIHFSGPEYSAHSYDRINGFRNAFSESSLIFNESLIIPCGSYFQDGLTAGLKYFKNISKTNFPMAVVCYNDISALGLIAALHKLEIQIPNQVSIIGHDDIELAKQWSPALTTMHSPQHDLGMKATEVLIRHIEAKSILAAETHIFNAELRVRESTLDLTQ